MDAVWAPLGVILAAIVSGIVSWLVAKRKSGGTVKTSESTELWNASQELRKMLQDEAKARTEENRALRQEAVDCHKIQAGLERRIMELERQVANSGGSQGRHRPAQES